VVASSLPFFMHAREVIARSNQAFLSNHVHGSGTHEMGKQLGRLK